MVPNRKNRLFDAKIKIMLYLHFPEWDSEILSKFDVKKVIEKYEECSTIL